MCQRIGLVAAADIDSMPLSPSIHPGTITPSADSKSSSRTPRFFHIIPRGPGSPGGCTDVDRSATTAPLPPWPPKYVPKKPPGPRKTTPCPRAVQCQDTAAHPRQPQRGGGGGVQCFVDGVLIRRAMYRFAGQQPKKNSLVVWQEGMRISRSHFLGRDEEHAAVVLETISATPQPPASPSRPARLPPCRPLPPLPRPVMRGH